MTSPSGIFVPAPHAPRRLAGPDFIRLWLVIQPRRCPRDFPGRREAPFCPCHRACCSWTYLFFLWFVFLFVHRYLSFTCRVCSFAQPVPTSSSRRPSRRNACQARRFYSFKGVRPQECEPYSLRRKCRQFDTATNGSLRPGVIPFTYEAATGASSLQD